MFVKNVTWEMVRNLSNRLTNQLYLGLGVDASQAHMSDFPGGPVREFFSLRNEYRKCTCNPDCQEGWFAFNEEDVNFLRWKSLSSGSILEAEKVGQGRWTLTFIPSTANPDYRGHYFYLFSEVENLENIPSPVVRQERRALAS